MGYEEALGYTVGTLVRDKDGVSGATVFADFVAHLATQGRTVHDELALCAERYGNYLSEQVSLTLPGADGRARMGRMMDAVRAALRAHTLTTIGGLAVGEVTDLPAPTQVLAITLGAGSRVMLRPSGTEPKIKLYFDVRDGAETLQKVVAEFRAFVEAVP